MPIFVITIGLFITFGCLAFAVGIWHSLRWRQRYRTWITTEGTVVNLIENYDETNPEIEYTIDGQTKKFRSTYSSNVKVGTTVTLVHDPKTGAAELIDKDNQFMMTLGFYGSALLFWGAAIGIWKLMG